MHHLARGRVWLAGALLGLVLGGWFYWATPAKFRRDVVVELTAVSPTIDLGAVRGRPKLESVDTDANMLASDDVVSSVARASGDPAMGAHSDSGVGAKPDPRRGDHLYQRDTGGARGSQQCRRRIADRSPAPGHPAGTGLPQRGREADGDTARRRGGQPRRPFRTAEFRVENWRDRALAARLQLPDAGTVLQRATTSSGAQRGPMEVPLDLRRGPGCTRRRAARHRCPAARAGRVTQARRIQLVVRHGGALLKARTLPAADAAP